MHLGSTADLMPLAQADAVSDGLAQAVVPEVVIEDAWAARVRQDVGIPLMQMVPGEGPVVQRGSCVMILCSTA